MTSFPHAEGARSYTGPPNAEEAALTTNVLEKAERQTPEAHKPAAAGPLPALRTGLSPAEVMERLRVASRRGRLAGFEAGDASTFTVAAHGQPFDGQLIGRCESVSNESRVTFDLRMLPKMPATFAVILILSIWPGVYFMDELIAQLLPGLWRPWVTYYWYLPLTILPTPFLWKSVMAKSRRTMREHADETLASIARETGGSLEG